MKQTSAETAEFTLEMLQKTSPTKLLTKREVKSLFRCDGNDGLFGEFLAKGRLPKPIKKLTRETSYWLAGEMQEFFGLQAF